jgi:hypothetical protein
MNTHRHSYTRLFSRVRANMIVVRMQTGKDAVQLKLFGLE